MGFVIVVVASQIVAVPGDRKRNAGTVKFWVNSSDSVSPEKYGKRERLFLCPFGNRKVRLGGLADAIDCQYVRFESGDEKYGFFFALRRNFVEVRKLTPPESVEIAWLWRGLPDLAEPRARAAVEGVAILRPFAAVVHGRGRDSDKSRNPD